MKKVGVAVLFLAIVALVGGSRLYRLYNTNAIHAAKKVDLYLPKSIGVKQLQHLLVDSLHVADDKNELNWAANLLGWRKFQPGHYLIDHSYTYNKFLSKLAKGNQVPISVTIPPGRYQAEIASLLVHKMRFDSLEFHQALLDSSIFDSAKRKTNFLIGHLFPATYQWYWTAPPQKVIKDIFKQFRKQVAQPYQKQAQHIKLSLHQVLTLASIIEGEALHDKEKPKISGLYYNRLQQKMPLQADPTVIYAVGKRRRLYFKDYKIKSLYNTYLHRGLPPGPINNPSLSSIKAAMHPADNNYLYMVAKPDGYHAFSKSYAEHKRQSRKWRRYLEDQSRAMPSQSN